MSTLKNKSYKEYFYTSRYSAFPYYYNVEDNKYIYGLTAYLSDTTPFTVHTVVQGDTFDTLALKYYNNPTLYWIICSFNQIRDPYQQLVIGTKIKVPSLSNVEYEIDGRF